MIFKKLAKAVNNVKENENKSDEKFIKKTISLNLSKEKPFTKLYTNSVNVPTEPRSS